MVVTVPLGVLKAPDGPRFSPPLTARKRGAIKRIGFGCMNKVGLQRRLSCWKDCGVVYIMLVWLHAHPAPSQRFTASHALSPATLHQHFDCCPAPFLLPPLPRLQVILLFPHAFWGDDKDMFGRVADVPEVRKRLEGDRGSSSWGAAAGRQDARGSVCTSCLDTCRVWRLAPPPLMCPSQFNPLCAGAGGDVPFLLVCAH